MLFTLSLTSLCMVSFTQATCSLSISPNKDNMIASRLEGNWTFNGELSARLAPDGKTSEVPGGEMILTYSNDPSVLEKIPEDNCLFLENSGLSVFLAGTLQFFHIEFGVMSHTYVLTSMEGVPVIIYWQGDNAVTNFIQMGPAGLPQNDLLFIGEGDSDMPFGVLDRLGTKLSLCRDEVDKTPRQ